MDLINYGFTHSGTPCIYTVYIATTNSVRDIYLSAINVKKVGKLNNKGLNEIFTQYLQYFDSKYI